MSAITFRNRWLTTYQHLQSAVWTPQRTLPLGKPALWKRLILAGWVMYRAADVRRVRGTPGMAFDVIVVSLFLVLGAVNLII